MSGPGYNLTASSLFNVQNKVALVTGGGSGIGTMIASALVENGAKVYIASRKEKQLKEVSDRLNKVGPGSCHYLIGDLGSKAGCDALAAAFKEKESKLHILFNNSGATWGAPYNDTPEKEGWDRVMALNVKGIFYLTVGLTDVLAKESTAENPAKVINISSVAGFDAHAEGSSLSDSSHGLWAYHTSKAAANHLTQLLSVTLSKKYITVNAICPGVFPSKMTAFSYQKSGADKLAKGHPMGRVGDARDMGALALFLASPGSRHINGALIPIDGGALVHGHPLGQEDEEASTAKL